MSSGATSCSTSRVEQPPLGSCVSSCPICNAKKKIVLQKLFHLKSREILVNIVGTSSLLEASADKVDEKLVAAAKSQSQISATRPSLPALAVCHSAGISFGV